MEERHKTWEEIIGLYNKLHRIRVLMDENLPKAKQLLTNLLTEDIPLFDRRYSIV